MNTEWVPFALVCAFGLGRALTANVPAEPPPADVAEKTFPTDLWSRDDDFHQREAARARDWARTHHMRVGDALSAIDEGLREHWPSGSPTPLVATVPPCRPRAIY